MCMAHTTYILYTYGAKKAPQGAIRRLEDEEGYGKIKERYRRKSLPIPH